MNALLIFVALGGPAALFLVIVAWFTKDVWLERLLDLLTMVGLIGVIIVAGSIVGISMVGEFLQNLCPARSQKTI